MQSIKGTSLLRTALGALVLAGSAFAQDPAPPPTSVSDSGFSLGLRAGYGVPLGKSVADVGTRNNDLSNGVKGLIPGWLDVGYRFASNWYVGGFYQFGFGLFPDPGCPTGASCTIFDHRFGVNVHYHFMPGEMLDPWVGLGAGYEILNTSVSVGGVSGGGQVNGFEFGNAQVGLDWTVSPMFSFGPFVAFTVGQFDQASATGVPSASIANKAIHEWLQFGLRGVFNIGM